MRRLIFGLLAALALGIATWQMLAYRDRWHAIVDNDRWEVHLREAHVYEVPRIVLFGDSIFGYWPMAESFGTLPIIDRGVHAQWAMTAGERFDRDALNLKPKILVILLGTNDLEHQRPVNEIVANVGRLVDRAQEKGIKVILCGVLPTSGEWLKYHPPAVMRGLNVLLHSVADSRGIEFVDFYPTMADERGELPAALTQDGLHPNRAGYSRMTNQLLPILLRDLTG